MSYGSEGPIGDCRPRGNGGRSRCYPTWCTADSGRRWRQSPAQVAPDYGEQGDATALDGEGRIVVIRPWPDGGGAAVAAAAGPLWRRGAVGHQRPRVARAVGCPAY